MKVLLVDQFAKKAGKDSLELARSMSALIDQPVTLYLADDAEIYEDDTVRIIRGFHDVFSGNLLRKAYKYFIALRQLEKHIRSEKYDIIHLQWFALPWYERFYIKKLKKLGKIAVTIHDVIPFDNRLMEKQCLECIYKAADVLLIQSATALKTFNETYMTLTPTRVISQNFRDKSQFSRIDRDEAKRHFGIPEDMVVYLFYGTIRKSKGFSDLVKAISSAYKQNQKIYLLAGGEPHNMDREMLQNLIDENIGKDGCHVCFGYIPNEDEKWYFSAADVLCLPYREVTQSGVAHLGLMYELPIIATNVGSLGEVIRSDENGKLIPANDFEALKNAILELAKEKDKRERYSNQSAYMAENEFSVKVKAEEVVEIYRELMETTSV